MILGKIVLSFSSLLIFLLVASIYILFFYQNPPIVILNDPVPTDKQQYKPGDRVVISVEADIRSQSPSTLFITWRGETPQPIPVAVIKITGLPFGRVDRTFPIAVVPQVLMPGRYVLEMESVYNLTVFPVERTVEWRSIEFEVIREDATSTVPITAYLFLADQSGESPSNLANEMPRLEVTTTDISTPESTSAPSVPSSPMLPTSVPTVAISSSTAAPSMFTPTAIPTPKLTPVPSIVPTSIVLPTSVPPPLPTIDVPPVGIPPLPPIDPPPIFIPPLPPIDVPPIDVPPLPPIDVPSAPVPPLPPILP